MRVDGTLTTIPATPLALAGGGSVGTYGLSGTVIVVWPDGSVAIVQAVGVYPEYYRFTVNLGLASGRLGHMVGLLGNADGAVGNDLVTRSGQPVTYPNTPFADLYGTYINSWRISQAESLFDYGAGETTQTFTDLTFPDAPATPQNLPAAARTSATNVCALFGLTTPELSNACIVDVGITGDGDFANSAADAQEAGLGIPSNTGGATLETSMPVSTTASGENAVRTFPGTAGQKLTLTISNNTYAQADITVRDPNGVSVTSLFVSTADVPRRVHVASNRDIHDHNRPRSTFTGSLTFLLRSVPDNTGRPRSGRRRLFDDGDRGERYGRSRYGGSEVDVDVVEQHLPAGGCDGARPERLVGHVAFASTADTFRDVFTLARPAPTRSPSIRACSRDR
jgi:hypothetical protein